MKQYVCGVCGYVYDEAAGIPSAGIAPGTKWEALPEDWTCPLCGAGKAEFSPKEAPAAPWAKPAPKSAAPDEDLKELSPLEMSALCSNLARGCEKQYKPGEAARFAELAAYFKAGAAPAEQPGVEKLVALIEKDLAEGIPAAAEAAVSAGDRGARRALVWNEKVTRILKSLLARYQREGDEMLKNTGVFVCTICGFVFLGERAPELCPVCKVQSFKFEQVEGR